MHQIMYLKCCMRRQIHLANYISEIILIIICAHFLALEKFNIDAFVFTNCYKYTLITLGCIQNTLTGDESSCSASRCECKVGYAGDDCCECDLEGENGQHHYEDPVTGKCIRKYFISPDQCCMTILCGTHEAYNVLMHVVNQFWLQAHITSEY